MELVWRSEKVIKFGDFCHFAPIATNFLRAKIYPILTIFLYFDFFSRTIGTACIYVKSNYAFFTSVIQNFLRSGAEPIV